jgi:integrase
MSVLAHPLILVENRSKLTACKAVGLNRAMETKAIRVEQGLHLGKIVGPKTITPKLRDSGLNWISFQILRRSHTTHNQQLGADPATMAKQQGHGIGVHAEVYYQPDADTLIRESFRLYTRFEKECEQSLGQLQGEQKSV